MCSFLAVSLRDDDEDSAVQERAFVDLMPHVGSFLLRGFIRRVGQIWGAALYGSSEV